MSEESTEKVTTEETTVEKPVLNNPSDLTGVPQAVEKTTTVTETHESNE